MKRFLIAFGIIALSLLGGQGGRSFLVCRLGVCNPVVATRNLPFTPLHLFFMSPSGSDAAAGTSTSTAWASPNHALNCGDVIIAAPGTYTAGGFGSWGTVSNCPSTSGGIDGGGGIYFAILLCAGSDLGTTNGCSASTTSNPYFNVTKDNWSIQGWTIAGNALRAFQVDTCAGVTPIAFHAFINNVTSNSAMAFGNNGGCSAPPTGADYFAVVGNIAQNGASDPICLAAIDDVQPATLNNNTGTHVIFYGNFSYNNTNTTCRSLSDTEDYMFDTWDAVTYLGVIDNNIGFLGDRYGIQILDAPATAGNFHIYNNTFFENNTHTGTDTNDGEINPSSFGAQAWNLLIGNNIAYQPLATSASGGRVAAFVLSSTSIAGGATYTNGATGTENVYFANNSNCAAPDCDSTFSNNSYAGPGALGTNTYVNPAFNNTTDLLANQIGVPNCAGFQTVTACMGWNANTQTLTNPSIIYDLQPTAAGTTGKGYQLPSTTCITSGLIFSDYPAWLKGIVYLHASGFVNSATITENSDLVTKPCGM